MHLPTTLINWSLALFIGHMIVVVAVVIIIIIIIIKAVSLSEHSRLYCRLVIIIIIIIFKANWYFIPRGLEISKV